MRNAGLPSFTRRLCLGLSNRRHEDALDSWLSNIPPRFNGAPPRQELLYITLHYDLPRLRFTPAATNRTIKLSASRNDLLHKCAATMISMTSGLSLGSPREQISVVSGSLCPGALWGPFERLALSELLAQALQRFGGAKVVFNIVSSRQ
jgi:hypothetical protein